MGDLSTALRAEQGHARAAGEAAGRHHAEAAGSAVRVAQVEGELREVLSELEAHKAASAAKFAVLQQVLADGGPGHLLLPRLD